jgi:hypothetical protein
MPRRAWVLDGMVVRNAAPRVSAVTIVYVSATVYMITLSAAASETLNHTPEISLHILQFVSVQ